MSSIVASPLVGGVRTSLTSHAGDKPRRYMWIEPAIAAMVKIRLDGFAGRPVVLDDEHARFQPIQVESIEHVDLASFRIDRHHVDAPSVIGASGAALALAPECQQYGVDRRDGNLDRHQLRPLALAAFHVIRVGCQEGQHRNVPGDGERSGRRLAGFAARRVYDSAPWPAGCSLLAERFDRLDQQSVSAHLFEEVSVAERSAVECADFDEVAVCPTAKYLPEISVLPELGLIQMVDADGRGRGRRAHGAIELFRRSDSQRCAQRGFAAP